MSRPWSLALAAIVGLAASRGEAATIRVAVDMVAYAPARISAHVGDTIEWMNSDFVAHTATGRNKEWDVLILPNKSAHITATRPGEIDYYCRFHPNMVGHVSVTP